MIRRLCIIGVGLIGGSLARALRRAGYVQEIVGCSRRVEHLQEAVTLGVIDRFETDAARAIDGADMIVVCVPLGAMEQTFRSIAPVMPANAVLTDVGSAKASVVAAARATFGEIPARFVPGHPIAGTEKSGVMASFAELYQNRKVILTPLSETDPAAIAQVQAMWEVAGAQVQCMDVEHHDDVLAATSHLPHLLAFQMVDTLARMRDEDEIFRYAAGGFRDFTRIASSDPVMWRDICLANARAVLDMLDHYRADLDKLVAAIESADGVELERVFRNAKTARDRHNER